MALALLHALEAAGHSVAVLARETNAPSFEGIPIRRRGATRALLAAYTDADVILTHLDETGHAMTAATRTRRPLVHIVHNDRQLEYHHVTARAAALVVFNSQWIARKVQWPGPSLILYPPIDPATYQTETTGEAITLINLNEAKGGRLFWNLAARLRDRLFLGVRGAYGDQIMPPPHLTNVEVIDNSPEIRAVYARTRLLLMPSSYESFGRTGIEAATSGIPTIAAPTPGLRESLASAGRFVPLNKPAAWIAAIRRLDSPTAYSAASTRARRRAGELAEITGRQLTEFVDRIGDLNA